MVQLVVSLDGHQDSWAHRVVGCLSPLRHRLFKRFQSLFGNNTVKYHVRASLFVTVGELHDAHCDPCSTVIVLGYTRALGGTVKMLEQFVKRSRRSLVDVQTP